MKSLFSSLLIVALVLFANGCRTEDGPLTPSPAGLVRTDLTGVVLTEDGAPLAGVTVTSHGKTATSNAFGAFYIKNADVPADRAVVSFSKQGYFTTGKVGDTKAGGLTTVRVVMQQQTNTGAFTASLGGTVQLPGGPQVSFNPNSIVSANGQAYSGIVRVAMRHLDPAGSRFADLFPGDLQARRTDGSDATLYSLGVLRVVLTDANGQALQLANGAKARIEVPISPSQSAIAPAQIPLWFYDIQEGIWKEEGSANKVGTLYIGEVSHFTDWNCDIPERTATVRGQLLCSGEPVPGVWVRVGQRLMYTDSLGNFITRVPAGIELDAEIEADMNVGLTAPKISIAPLSAQEVRVITLTISNCPGYLTAVIKNCEGDPVSGILSVSVGSMSRAFFAQNGAIRVPAPSGQALTVKAYTVDGLYSNDISAGPLNPGQSVDLGDIRVCQGTAAQVLNYNVPRGMSELSLSCDGSLMALRSDSLSPGGIDSIFVYRTSDGSLVSKFTTPPGEGGYGSPRSLWFTDDNTRLLVGGWTTSHLFDVQSGARVRSYTGVSSPKMSGDGSLLATWVSAQRVFRLLDGSNGSTLLDIPVPGGVANTEFTAFVLGFSTDKQTLYFAISRFDRLAGDSLFIIAANTATGQSSVIGRRAAGGQYVQSSKNSEAHSFVSFGRGQVGALVLFSVRTGNFVEYREANGTFMPYAPMALTNTEHQMLRSNAANIPGLYDYSNGSVLRVLGDPLEFGTALSWDADCGSQFYGALRLAPDQQTYVRLWRR